MAESTPELRSFLAQHALFGRSPAAAREAWLQQVRTVQVGPGDAAPTGAGSCLIATGAMQSGDQLLHTGALFAGSALAYAVAPSTLYILPAEALPADALVPAAVPAIEAPAVRPVDLGVALLLQSLCVFLGALPLLLAKPLIDYGVLVRDPTLAPLMLAGLACAAILLGAALGLRQVLLTVAVSDLRCRQGAQAWQRALDEAALGTATPLHLQQRLLLQAARLLHVGVRAPALLHDGVGLPIYGLLLVLLSPRMALWGAAAGGLSLLVGWGWRRHNAGAQAAAQTAEAQLASFVHVHGDSPWQPHQSMALQLQAHSRATAQRAQRTQMRGRFYAQGARSALLVAVLALGTHAARHGSLELGTLVAGAGLLDGLAAALSRLWTVPVAWPRRWPQRAGTPAVPQQARAGPVVPRGHLQLRGVRLTYAAGRAGLWDLDLQLAPGEAVMICGASGSGKTTLARLLCGLLQPQAGRVHIDGAAPPIRAQHCLGRTPWIWHGSVRDNLTLHDPSLNDLTLLGVAHVAGWDIDALPQGLATQVHSQGALNRLQATQLGLTRALLQRPCLLVLDDTLEGLDMDRRADLVRRLQGCTPRPTLVLLGQHALPAALGVRTLHLHGGRLVHP